MEILINMRRGGVIQGSMFGSQLRVQMVSQPLFRTVGRQNKCRRCLILTQILGHLGGGKRDGLERLLLLL